MFFLDQKIRYMKPFLIDLSICFVLSKYNMFSLNMQ